MKKLDTIQTLTFAAPADWRMWLSKNYTLEEGIWLKLAKKNSGIPSITYAEALDEALCYGWIDGLKRPFDDKYWLQRFSPRRAKSVWSKVNREHIERLANAGKMEASGLTAVEAAKADGRWDAAYDSPSKMTIPEDFQQVLDANATAHEFYKTLNKTNTYAILYRIQSAKKPETRTRRIEQIIEMLANGDKIHP